MTVTSFGSFCSIFDSRFQSTSIDDDEAVVAFSVAMVYPYHSLQCLLCDSIHMDTESVVGSLETKSSRNGTVRRFLLRLLCSKEAQSHHYCCSLARRLTWIRLKSLQCHFLYQYWDPLLDSPYFVCFSSRSHGGRSLSRGGSSNASLSTPSGCWQYPFYVAHIHNNMYMQRSWHRFTWPLSFP